MHSHLIFDGRKYPWFSDGFVHPKDLQKSYKEAEPLVNLLPASRKCRDPRSSRFFPIAAAGEADDRRWS